LKIWNIIRTLNIKDLNYGINFTNQTDELT